MQYWSSKLAKYIFRKIRKKRTNDKSYGSRWQCANKQLTSCQKRSQKWVGKRWLRGWFRTSVTVVKDANRLADDLTEWQQWGRYDKCEPSLSQGVTRHDHPGGPSHEQIQLWQGFYRNHWPEQSCTTQPAPVTTTWIDAFPRIWPYVDDDQHFERLKLLDQLE